MNCLKCGHDKFTNGRCNVCAFHPLEEDEKHRQRFEERMEEALALAEENNELLGTICGLLREIASK